jgi:hypothetical protein
MTSATFEARWDSAVTEHTLPHVQPQASLNKAGPAVGNQEMSPVRDTFRARDDRARSVSGWDTRLGSEI